MINPRRHKDHWKWYRFAVESQDVLVWGHIPGNAVLTSIPLLQILSRLPSYFLFHDIADAKDSPLFKLGLDHTKKKPSFRQFCQTTTDRFMQMPVDRRLRDTTAGSVRLALALLRPYFHEHISDDFAAATETVFELAYVIAQWPGQWWTREHPEIRDLVRCIVHMIGEEMREARRVQALADATRMQDVVGGLEKLVQEYEARARQRRVLQLSPIPSPSPTLGPPSPAMSDHKRHFRMGSMDLVTDDMLQSIETQIDDVMQSKGIQTDPSIHSPNSTQGNDDTVHILPWKATPARPTPRSYGIIDAVARTTSCFLTGILIGSFITLCVLAPDRRPIIRNLT